MKYEIYVILNFIPVSLFVILLRKQHKPVIDQSPQSHQCVYFPKGKGNPQKVILFGSDRSSRSVNFALLFNNQN